MEEKPKIKKNKLIFILIGTIFSIVLVFAASYSITIHSITTSNYINRINKLIDRINIIKLEAKETENNTSSQKQYTLTYKLTFKIPAGLTKDELLNTINFSLELKNQTKELAGTNLLQGNKDYTIVKTYTTGDMYTVTFTFPNSSLTKDNVNYLIKNKKSDIQLLIYNRNEVQKKFKV